jgi:hypothetical protein
MTYKVTTIANGKKSYKYFSQEKYANRWKNLVKSQGDTFGVNVKTKMEKVKA